MKKQNNIGIVNVYPKHINHEIYIPWVDKFRELYPESLSWDVDISITNDDPLSGASAFVNFDEDNVSISLNSSDPRQIKILYHELLHPIMVNFSDHGDYIFDYSDVDLHPLTISCLKNLYTSFEDWFIELGIYNLINTNKDNHEFLQAFISGTFNDYLENLILYDLTNYSHPSYMLYIEHILRELFVGKIIPPRSMWCLYNCCLYRNINKDSLQKHLPNLAPIEKKLVAILNEYSDIDKLSKDYYKSLFCDFFNTITNHFFGYDVVKRIDTKIQLLATFEQRVKWVEKDFINGTK